MYDLIYEVNGKAQEVILTGRPKGVCYWKKGLLEESGNYNNGKLRVIKQK